MNWKWTYYLGFFTVYTVLNYMFDYEPYNSVILFMILVLADMDTFS